MLLLILRILQGFSVGGELTGSAIFLVEHAPHSKRGFYGSLSMAGQYLGLLIAVIVALWINNRFQQAAVVRWIWRLPFLFAIIGGFWGWLARLHVHETKLFQQAIPITNHYLSLYRGYVKHLRHTLLIVGIILFGTVASYLTYVFSVTYMHTILNYPLETALKINIFSIILLVLLVPCGGKLSDIIGRRLVMIYAAIGGLVWAWPYFWLLQQHTFTLALIAQGIITIFIAMYFSSAIVATVEIVPVQLRFSIVAVAYALATSIFGGATPLIATLLLKLTHSYISLALYLMICTLISLIAVYKVKETKGVPLP